MSYCSFPASGPLDKMQIGLTRVPLRVFEAVPQKITLRICPYSSIAGSKLSSAEFNLHAAL